MEQNNTSKQAQKLSWRDRASTASNDGLVQQRRILRTVDLHLVGKQTDARNVAVQFVWLFLFLALVPMSK